MWHPGGGLGTGFLVKTFGEKFGLELVAAPYAAAHRCCRK